MLNPIMGNWGEDGWARRSPKGRGQAGCWWMGNCWQCRCVMWNPSLAGMLRTLKRVCVKHFCVVPWVTHGQGFNNFTASGKIPFPSWRRNQVWPRTLGNTVRLTFVWWKMALCIRSALTCMMLTFCAWYYPSALRETGAKARETDAKKGETGAEKNVYHLTLLLWPSCCVAWFWRDFFFPHGPNRRHCPKRRRRHVVLSLWGACCFSLSLASLSIAPFGTCIGFIPILFDFIWTRRACF